MLTGGSVFCDTKSVINYERCGGERCGGGNCDRRRWKVNESPML